MKYQIINKLKLIKELTDLSIANNYKLAMY